MTGRQRWMGPWSLQAVSGRRREPMYVWYRKRVDTTCTQPFSIVFGPEVPVFGGSK